MFCLRLVIDLKVCLCVTVHVVVVLCLFFPYYQLSGWEQQGGNGESKTQCVCVLGLTF